MQERLQKYLADAGYCSRREAERWIVAGWIMVNGKKAEIGQKVDKEKDTIEVLRQADKATQNRVYYKFYKPVGIHTVNAPEWEQEIADIVDLPGCFPVGRLDKDSSGLVILTNDGRVSRFVFSPEASIEKEYIVDTYGPASEEQVFRMAKGGIFLERATKPCKIERLASGTLRFVIREGMNRQIRRMCDFVGLRVKNLKRLRVGDVRLANMQEGDLSPLSQAEQKSMFPQVQAPKMMPPRTKRSPLSSR